MTFVCKTSSSLIIRSRITSINGRTKKKVRYTCRGGAKWTTYKNSRTNVFTSFFTRLIDSSFLLQNWYDQRVLTQGNYCHVSQTSSFIHWTLEELRTFLDVRVFTIEEPNVGKTIKLNWNLIIGNIVQTCVKYGEKLSYWYWCSTNKVSLLVAYWSIDHSYEKRVRKLY